MAITKVSRNLLNTGVSDSSDATAITITSAEKVLLGTSTASSSAGARLVLGGATENYIQFSSTNNVGGIIGVTSAGNIPFYTHTGAVGSESFSERLRILADGGLTFNGDTAAANALDDYEEGLWTPTIASGGSVTSTSARYTKIGNIVRATARLSSFSFTNVDGTHFTIGGLPYTMHSNSNIGFAWGDTGTQGKAVYFWSGSGGGSSLFGYWGGSGYDSVTHNEVPAGFNLILNLVYGHG